MIAEQILIGCLLMVVTTFVHAGCNVMFLWTVRHSRVQAWTHGSLLVKTSLISGLVLLMFLAALVEVTIWAATYLAHDAVPDMPTALYFSMVTFTTLGYGDVLVGDQARLLASFEAANGIILFGWTTALIFAFIHRVMQPDIP